ncbi:MAG: PTS sugar transporter subunit IIA [Sinobacterium sp.]|nr:PTS sugar transporter subunit IIA [Sinobacterium sp.]
MITQYFESELTFSHVEANSKKRALEKAAEKISRHITAIDSEQLFELLIARERLGSTGIGKGIAIPHCRHEDIDKISCCLLTLNEAVDFDAIDDNPVDILFILVVPEKACNQHLETLANLAKLMDNAEYRNQIRQAITNQELFEYAKHMQE